MGDADRHKTPLCNKLYNAAIEKEADEPSSILSDADDGMYDAACLSFNSLDQIYKDNTVEIEASPFINAGNLSEPFFIVNTHHNYIENCLLK